MTDLPMYSVQEVPISNGLISQIINTSQLDSQANKCPWILTKAEIVQHAQFDCEYEEKKAETLGFSQANSNCDLSNRYGFCTESDDEIIKQMLLNGLMISNVKYNTLGFSKCGSYVTRFIDVCLKYYHFQNPSEDDVRVVIFKYFLGKVTKCVPKASYATEIIEPTQGFDAHQSVIEPTPIEPIHQQFEKSQVYLYEFDSLRGIPVMRPRQCIPVAVLSYTKDKMLEAEIYRTRECAKMSSSDLEDSGSQCSNNSASESLKGNDRFANNPQLKAIVDAINSRPINSAPILPRRKRVGAIPTGGAGGVDNCVSVSERLANNPQLKAIVDQINSRPALENAPMLPPRNGRVPRSNGKATYYNQTPAVTASSPNYGYNDAYYDYNDQYYEYVCDSAAPSTSSSSSSTAFYQNNPWQTQEPSVGRIGGGATGSVNAQRGANNLQHHRGGSMNAVSPRRGSNGYHYNPGNQKQMPPSGGGASSSKNFWDSYEYGSGAPAPSRVTNQYHQQQTAPLQRHNENGSGGAVNFGYHSYNNDSYYNVQPQNHRGAITGGNGVAKSYQGGRGLSFRGRGRGRGNGFQHFH
ncbi:uncharacterized protein LOC141908812 [Tubulanus polymorphus]|uniref:uncharacterized protein LOC141908812 n=1 Tax=Tubulanus polymorphus TaxID=672921 RepID=UPI003DA6685E